MFPLSAAKDVTLNCLFSAVFSRLGCDAALADHVPPYALKGNLAKLGRVLQCVRLAMDL